MTSGHKPRLKGYRIKDGKLVKVLKKKPIPAQYKAKTKRKFVRVPKH
jgi:hypothetical protein